MMNAYVDPTTMRFDAAIPASDVRSAPAARTAKRGGRFGAQLMAALRWVAEMPRRHAVIAELQALSDRELSDVGLTRGDLPMLFTARYAGRDRI